MPYSAHASPAEYDRIKTIVLELGDGGREFDANDVLAAAIAQPSRGHPLGLSNAGNIGQVLDDLADLGIIEKASERDDSEPPWLQRWRLA